MKDWFKNDPLTTAVVLVAALVLIAVSYFAYVNYATLSAETEEYETGSAALNRLHGARPFPDAHNLKLVSSELEEAKQTLEQILSAVERQSAPLDRSLTPEKFQDALNAKVGKLADLAAAKRTALAEDFYLGFGEYRAQPPSPEAAPFLGQQLEAIAHVASLVINNGAAEILSIQRQRLPVEAVSSSAESAKSERSTSALTMSPFDIAFVSDHSSFRNAFAAIVTSNPMVLVRLLSVANSQPSPPSKATASGETFPAESATVEESIPVVFGRETLTVKMRLASVSLAPAAEQP